MILDLPSYIKLLKAAYEKIITDGTMPQLADPKRSAIRNACIELYSRGLDKKDEPALIAFYGTPNSEGDFEFLINNFITDDYRTLQNFMNGTTQTTDHKNIELLAWLIGFRHRPFRLNLDVTLTQEEECILVERPGGPNLPPDRPGLPIPPAGTEKEPTNNGQWLKKLKQGAAILTACTIVSAGIYTMVPSDNTNCMYWTGDHYEKIACNEKPKGRLIIPFDENQFAIQKINRADTIAERHIGKLYYIKNNNKPEYFTHGGKYPEDLKRELQEISQRIYDKYIKPQTDSLHTARTP